VTKCVALLLASLAVGGCGSSSSAPPPTPKGPSQAVLDHRDTAAIERQVQSLLDDRMQPVAAAQGTFVQSDTACTKQSDTAYKCLTTFTTPSTASVVTTVTCDRNGGSCITETR
jgi:hypothetical protein